MMIVQIDYGEFFVIVLANLTSGSINVVLNNYTF